MKTIYTVTVIAMVAVIMGMSSFAPFVMADDDEPTETICHVKNNKSKTMDISEPSAAEHLADHADDYAGECIV